MGGGTTTRCWQPIRPHGRSRQGRLASPAGLAGLAGAAGWPANIYFNFKTIFKFRSGHNMCREGYKNASGP